MNKMSSVILILCGLFSATASAVFSDSSAPIQGRAPSVSIKLVNASSGTPITQKIIPGADFIPLKVAYVFSDDDGDEEFLSATDKNSTQVEWLIVYGTTSPSTQRLKSGAALGFDSLDELDYAYVADKESPKLRVCVTPRTDPLRTLPSSGIAQCTDVEVAKTTSVTFTQSKDPSVNVDGNMWTFRYTSQGNRSVANLSTEPLVYGYSGWRICRGCPTSGMFLYGKDTESTSMGMHPSEDVNKYVAYRFTNNTGNALALSVDVEVRHSDPRCNLPSTCIFPVYLDKKQGGLFSNIQSFRVGKLGSARWKGFISSAPGDFIQASISAETHPAYGTMIVKFNVSGYMVEK